MHPNNLTKYLIVYTYYGWPYKLQYIYGIYLFMHRQQQQRKKFDSFLFYSWEDNKHLSTYKSLIIYLLFECEELNTGTSQKLHMTMPLQRSRFSDNNVAEPEPQVAVSFPLLGGSRNRI
jgi:hypothetical protein